MMQEDLNQITKVKATKDQVDLSEGFSAEEFQPREITFEERMFEQQELEALRKQYKQNIDFPKPLTEDFKEELVGNGRLEKVLDEKMASNLKKLEERQNAKKLLRQS